MTTTEIIRKNLFPNPNFSPTGLTHGLWGAQYVECFPGDGTLTVPEKDPNGTTAAQKQGYVQLDISGLLDADTEYVLSVIRLSGTKLCGIYYNNQGITVTPADHGDLLTLRFTPSRVHDPSSLMVNFDTGVWTRPIIEPAATYDAAMAGGGLRFFAWDTMPDPRSAS